MMKSMKKPRVKRYTLTLSEMEMRRLNVYAEQSGIDRPTALHRIVSQALRQIELSSQGQCDTNQLGLFDSLQIDIFNNTSRVDELGSKK